jgi:tetratricopeptide (TPR) repeat protein
VAYADAQLGRLVAWLDRAGLRQSTLFVATSDHGEGLGDHGEQEHLIFLYDSTLRVPALLSWPGRLPSAERVKGQFRSIDFVPTLLDLLGLPPSPTSGASRAAALRTGAPIADNASYAESLYGQLHYGWAPLRALRGEGLKLIDAPRSELYRVTDDPGELHNLIEARPQVAAAMRARLVEYDRGGEPRATEAPLDPAASERLAALGYVGGGFFTGSPSGADPKDKIAWYEGQRSEVSTALRLYREGDLDGALRLLERLARPERNASGQVVRQRSFNVSYTLGRALLAKRRYADAIAPLEEAIELYRRALVQDPLNATTYANLAFTLWAADRSAEAADAYRKVLELVPQMIGMHAQFSLTLLALGRDEEAMVEVMREPEEPFRLWARAIIHDAMGGHAESDQALRQLIDGYSETAASQIAHVHAARGEVDAAFEWLERAYGQRDSGLTEMKVIPHMRRLHGDPRWGPFLSKMGFEE